jgi:PST family polysaccharide transporter
MGFIIIAKAKQNIFIVAELAWAVVSLGLAWTCVRSFGLDGAGIAFFGSYIFHGFLIYPIARRLSGFRWSTENKQTGLVFLSLIAVVFCGFYVLPLLLAACVGTLAAVLSGAYSIRVLFKLIPLDSLPHPMRRLLVGFGFGPST